jgi:hypothetical protein
MGYGRKQTLNYSKHFASLYKAGMDCDIELIEMNLLLRHVKETLWP